MLKWLKFYLSSATSGATTKVLQTLKLVEESKTSNLALMWKGIGKTSNLLYNRASDETTALIDEQHVLKLLQSYKSTSESARPDIFTDLGEWLTTHWGTS